ncbi:uromodulin-like isoform X1 [Montipora foliosa]|uniref:uromodulin-like isoform X1 n=2 Tax=Montipora foliosa TaxID=591990 RepID=UPI0035F1CDE2
MEAVNNVDVGEFDAGSLPGIQAQAQTLSFLWSSYSLATIKMTKILHFYNTAVMYLVCSVCRADAQQCQSVHSTYGMMLRGHVFEKRTAANMLTCGQLCNADIRCQSINYVMSLHLCELNNRTKEARPNDYVQHSDRIYVTRPSERVPLGSIQEIPAEYCSEIKASEGDSVVSGRYWLDSVKPGQVVLVPCDMLTGDADECNASVPVCDANAICQNTLASFHCTCKTGFTGNGLSCQDFDECTSGAYNCINGKALCLNTLGSYKCTCKLGYRGDGQTYCILDECKNYQVLGNADRNVTSDATPHSCDSTLGPAWFRFQGNAGTKMPNWCVPENRCGTTAPGWLNGTHPQAHEGNVTRQVCFTYGRNCCNWSANIQVQNCSGYYLYYIHGTSPDTPCNLRYCSTD